MTTPDSSHQVPFPLVEGIDLQHRFVDIGGLRVHVAEAGHGEPLLMLHGWPQHWWMWRKQIPPFAQHFRVIAPDLRGFGWTEAPAGNYLKEQLVEDLVKLIRTLGYTQVRLLTHDWGGWIGYITSVKYPELILQHYATNIPLIWTKIDWRMIPATLRFGYMLRISMPYFGKRLLQKNNNFVAHLFTRGGTRKEGWKQEEIDAFANQFRDENRAVASSKLYGQFLLKEYLPVGLFGRYKKYRMSTPTRLLFGEKDFALATSWLRGYQQYVDDFQLEFIPDAGHFIVDERPELVTERTMQFFLDYNGDRNAF